MCTFKLRRSVFWGLVVCFLLAGMVGCQAFPSRLETRTTPTQVKPSPPPQAKPVEPSRKPVEATKDTDLRPSHWRRKLRAKYA